MSALAGKWVIRYVADILNEDVDETGEAAIAEAKKAIEKKLKVDPKGYGETLGPPLLGLHKLKSSKVRVVYRIEEAASEVWILMIGPRKTIWKRAQGGILTRLAAARKLWSRNAGDPPQKR